MVSSTIVLISVYTLNFIKDYGVLVCLYVDDILIFETNMTGIVEIKKYLTSMFKMQDLGEVVLS